MFTDVRKILVFKLCCFGDVVAMTPAVSALKKNFPDAKIYYAYAKWVEPLMQYLPDVDEYIHFRDVYSGNPLKKTSGAINFIRRVRSEKIDLVLNGHRNSSLSFILKLSGIRYRLGFSAAGFITHPSEFQKNLAESRKYLKVLTDNGLKAVDTPPLLKQVDRERIKVGLGIRHGKKVIGIFPFGGINPGTDMDIKRWGLNNYSALIKLIEDNLKDAYVLLFEGKKDNEKLPDDIKKGRNVVLIDMENNLICDYFISGDTGPLHMAAASGARTVSIFGPSDPEVVGPVTYDKKDHIIIWKKPVCSPCYNADTVLDKNSKHWEGNNFICYTGTHECIKSISVDEVYNDLIKLIKDN